MKKIDNPIAIAALEAAQDKKNSRQCSCEAITRKFVLRTTNELALALRELGENNRRSFNAEVVYALEESLVERKKYTVLRDALYSFLGEERSGKVWQEYPHINNGFLVAKNVIRLPEKTYLHITKAASKLKENGSKNCSMNSFIIDSLCWWIYINREIADLQRECLRN